MKRNPFVAVIISFLAIISFFSCQKFSFGTAKDSEAVAFVKGMGLGYNLGNTLDACGGTRGNKIENFEVSWGAPITTKEIFIDLKKRGFDTIRIPVAWSNLIGDDYMINAELMNRVEEIVNMVLDADMYAIVNIHWDGGWFADFPTAPETSMKKYRSIWTQIAERFKDADERLIFESLNEEGCFNDVWNRYADGDGSPKKQQAFDILNGINQNFVNLVRNSGGNNGTRYLLIAGYATDIDLTCSSEFRMPKDPAKRSIVSVHYYTPSTFTILEKDADWGKSAPSWGTDAELAQLRADMYKVKTAFIDKGIPAILGEYGTVIANKDPDSVRKYLTEVARAAWSVGMCPILWGAADQHYDRRKLTFTDPLLGAMYRDLAKTSRKKFAVKPPAAGKESKVIAAADTAVPAPAPAPAPEAPAVPLEVILDEKVGPSSGNILAESVGPVTIVVDKDTSYISNDTVNGATVQMVEYLGKKALRVTKNSRNEIRVAFVLDKPAKAAGYTSVQFNVSGFDGWDGSYNCGLLYTESKSSGERLGSFYIGRISAKEWVPVTVNLSYEEQWGKNFSPDRDVYCLQFWTNQGKALYISDLALN